MLESQSSFGQLAIQILRKKVCTYVCMCVYTYICTFHGPIENGRKLRCINERKLLQNGEQKLNVHWGQQKK